MGTPQEYAKRLAAVYIKLLFLPLQLQQLVSFSFRIDSRGPILLVAGSAAELDQVTQNEMRCLVL